MHTRPNALARMLFMLTMFCSLPAISGNEFGFYLNEYVKATDTLSVRAGAGTSYSLVGTVAKNAIGQIIGGPTYNNGYYWWKVKYAVINITGWCVQDYLVLYTLRDEENWSGTKVEVDGTGSEGLRLHSSAGIYSSVPASIPEGTVAAVTAGPVQANAYVWWKLVVVDTYQQGWAVQRFLSPYTPPPDTTRPIITMLGSSPISVAYGASYTDAGATATDNVDGTITSRIVKTGLPIPTTSPGVYYVRYNVRDDAGNAAAEVVRRVTVLEPSAPPPPPPATSVSLFDEGIATGWEDWSWGALVYASSSVYYNGTHGLSVGFQEAWGGLYLHHAPLSTSGLATLRFAANGANSEGQEPIVALTDANGYVIHELQLTDYIPGNVLVDDTWYSVVIPLTDLQAANSTISGFMVQSPTAPTGLYLDEISLSNVSGTTYSEPSTPPPPPPPPPTGASDTVFWDAIGTGWEDWSWATTDPDVPLHYEGSEGFAVTFTAPWQGVYFATDSFSTVGYNALSFAIHAGNTGGQTFSVALYDENGDPLTELDPTAYVVGGVLTPYVWHEVRIPLGDLNGLNRTVTGVTLQSATATAITLDEVRFISTTEPDTGVCNE